MKQKTVATETRTFDEKTEALIAIGAATAANCIPCFAYLFEKAITSGLTMEEIKGAAELAGRVKKGAHSALTNSINELMGDKATGSPDCAQTESKSCCC